MMDGYRKSAVRLSAATQEDRAWVLAQLDPADRLVLLAALKDTAAPVGAGETIAGSQPASKNPLLLPAGNVVAGLISADVETMVELLEREPSWVIALVVGEARFLWVEDYLARLKPSDLRHLETVVKKTQATVRPRVRQAVIEIIARRLEAYPAGKLTENAFDTLVARLRQQSKASAQPGEA
jgi:hypothetical protein